MRSRFQCITFAGALLGCVVVFQGGTSCAADSGIVASVTVPSPSTMLSRGRLVALGGKQVMLRLSLKDRAGEPFAERVELVVSPGVVWPVKLGEASNVFRPDPGQAAITVPYQFPAGLKSRNNVLISIRALEGKSAGQFIGTVEVPTARCAQLSVTISPGTVVADGAQTFTAEAQVRDQYGDPLANQPVEFRVCLPDEGEQRRVALVSDASGLARLPLGTTTKPGEATLQVTAGRLVSPVYRPCYVRPPG